MGTEVQLAITGGGADVLEAGKARLRELEGRWSRFLDTSEVTALNRTAGRPAIVSQDTYTLITRAVSAWHATGGRFDPTVGVAVAAHGYDRTFAEVAARTSVPPADHGPTPGAGAIDLVDAIRAVTLPVGVSFDPGVIGKGLAAYLTAELLLDEGADGVLVSVGGDLRVAGAPPMPEGWPITVPDPLRPDHELLRLAMPDGAVATSSRLLRRWDTASGAAHHLIDPSTGRPADTDTVAVTVVAREGWWAEALTKDLFLRPAGDARTIEGAHAVVVTADGTRHASAELRASLR
jgi:thiamine biosynthesis lipoprotein